MGVSICGVKYNCFLSSMTRPFFQKNDFSEGNFAFALIHLPFGRL